MHRNGSKAVSFGLKKYAELRLANARRVRQNGSEHWLQIAGRRADDLQDLGSRGELLQRLIPLAFKQRDLRFLASSRGTTPTHGLWRIAAL
jgi:hypothetical protein